MCWPGGLGVGGLRIIFPPERHEALTDRDEPVRKMKPRYSHAAAVCVAFTVVAGSISSCSAGSGPSARNSGMPTPVSTQGRPAMEAYQQFIPRGFTRWQSSDQPSCPSGSITVRCWRTSQSPASAAAAIETVLRKAGVRPQQSQCVDVQRYCVVRAHTHLGVLAFRIERLHSDSSPVVASWTHLLPGARVWLTASQ